MSRLMHVMLMTYQPRSHVTMLPAAVPRSIAWFDAACCQAPGRPAMPDPTFEGRWAVPSCSPGHRAADMRLSADVMDSSTAACTAVLLRYHPNPGA
jgi:hypothetical protein